MSIFELIRASGLGRLGKLITSNGTVYTPELMPVFNPNKPLISTKELIKEFKIKILITNAYIIYRTPHLKSEAEKGIHNLIEFPGVIMLDSGAYQAWMYKKDLSVSNKEIIEFQDLLRPNIATILDIFTDTDDYETAKKGVIETINRAKECIKVRDQDNQDILWAAPIQGGKFLDLIEYSAKKLSKLDFKYHPLGTLAPSLMNYEYRGVLDAIATAKLNMNSSRPLHAFSIGHPMFFSLSVLFGSDLFDSSSYALYAQNNRYITTFRTFNLNDLVEFPCTCPICSKYTPEELKRMDKENRIKNLAKHNLYVCLGEMKIIREAIRRDKLWELVQSRVRAHPNLIDAYFYNLMKYHKKIEIYDTLTKRTAFFYSGLDSLLRPEVLRHKKWLIDRYSPPSASILIILIDIIFRTLESKYFKVWTEKIKGIIYNINNLSEKDIHFCILSPIFGIIPIEIAESYPFSQYLYPNIFFESLSDHVSSIFKDYIKAFHTNYKKIIIFYPELTLKKKEIYKYPEIKLDTLPDDILKENKVYIVKNIEDIEKLLT